MDLKSNYPRSPKETLLGLVFLPRTIDKARAYKKETLGEYIYPCPLDKLVLDFLEADPEAFAQMVHDNPDEQIARWVRERCQNRSGKEEVNRKILERKPDDEDKWKLFNEIRDKIDPSRTDIDTWVDLIDLEEGRL